MKSAFYKQVTADLKAAGMQLFRSNTSHDIYRGGTSPRPVVVSRKLNDKRIYLRILKQAGVRHG